MKLLDIFIMLLLVWRLILTIHPFSSFAHRELAEDEGREAHHIRFRYVQLCSGRNAARKASVLDSCAFFVNSTSSPLIRNDTGHRSKPSIFIA